MSRKRCHYAKISWCQNLTDPDAESEPAFEVILWVEPEIVIEVTKVDPFPEMDDLSERMADAIAPLAMGFIEHQLRNDVDPRLIMGQLERRIRGSFYISKIGEEVRKDRDNAA